MRYPFALALSRRLRLLPLPPQRRRRPPPVIVVVAAAPPVLPDAAARVGQSEISASENTAAKRQTPRLSGFPWRGETLAAAPDLRNTARVDSEETWRTRAFPSTADNAGTR